MSPLPMMLGNTGCPKFFDNREKFENERKDLKKAGSKVTVTHTGPLKLKSYQ